MHRNPSYILEIIEDEHYLVPYGQAIELLAQTIQINEAAAFIWKSLEPGSSTASLARKLAQEYEASPEEAVSLEEDIIELIRDLKKSGAVLDDAQDLRPADTTLNSRKIIKQPVSVIKSDLAAAVPLPEANGDSFLPDSSRDIVLAAAGIIIRFSGRPAYFPKNFEPFRIDGNTHGRFPLFKKNEFPEDITVTVTEKVPAKINGIPVLLKGRGATVYDAESFYILHSMEVPQLREVHIAKDGSNTVIYIDRDSANQQIPSAPPESAAASGITPESIEPLLPSDTERLPALPAMHPASECVFQAIRYAFLIRAQRSGMYAIHSASILYKGRAWLFSALSGTGKSTHTNIWHKLYGTPHLNGDLNLLAFENGTPVVKGIPWCGGSGIFTTKTYPLGGIILLSRDERNHIEELQPVEKVLGIQTRFFTPKWTPEQASESIAFAKQIAAESRIARLHCNMENEAAEVCRAWIDGAMTH